MKRRRKVVSIEKKLEICRRHEMKQMYTSLSKEYDLGKLTSMTSSENDENTPPQHLVSSKDVLEALDICMKWMEQQEETTPQQVTPQQVMLFQKLKNDAAKKICEFKAIK